jgi:peptidyl-prolyl cis-trans isomerase C
MKDLTMNKILVIITVVISVIINNEIIYSKEISNEIKPDTIVAIINGKKKSVKDVMKFMPLLHPQLRQEPITKIFYKLRKQMISTILLEEAVKKSSLKLDPEVNNMINMIKKNALVKKLIGKIIEKKIKECNIEQSYLNYVQNFPKGKTEIRASHILINSEKKAIEIIKKIKNGAVFEKLAREKSQDNGSSHKGGDLGYFRKEEMVPKFSKVAFNLGINEYTRKPIKTNFGWHVIKKTDEKEIKPENYEKIRSNLIQELREKAITEYLVFLTKNSDIQTFNIYGKTDISI